MGKASGEDGEEGKDDEEQCFPVEEDAPCEAHANAPTFAHE